MSIVMYDSIEVSTVPANPQAVAGYVGGSWPDYSLLVRKFPNAHHLSVAVNSSEDADCLDIETGDAVPSAAPGWYARQKARGVALPCFYANTSTMPSVIANLDAAKVPHGSYRIWTAHFTFSAHIEPGSHATQWTDRALGRNLDQSECVDTFFTVAPSPPVTNPMHYDWFAPGLFESKWGKLNERMVVERYDGARQHPVRYALWIKYLESQLQFLANRVSYIAKTNPIDGKPSWGSYHRGWRFQQLVHRAQGQRFV